MNLKNIRHIGLESDAFLSDMDFVTMNSNERGAYFSLLLFLNCNGGFLDYDINKFKTLCNCENMKEVWKIISKKFIKTGNKILHKRVIKELRRARHISQMQSVKGVKGNEIRWSNHRKAIATATEQPSHSDSTGITKRSEEKAKGSEETRREDSEAHAQEVQSSEKPLQENLDNSKVTSKNHANGSPVSSLVSSPRFASQEKKDGPAATCPNHIVPLAQSRGHGGRIGNDVMKKLETLENKNTQENPGNSVQKSIIEQVMDFHDALSAIYGRKTTYDAASIRNLANWAHVRINTGRFNTEIFRRILEMALSSKKGHPRNPLAVFFSQVKRELGYGKD